MLLIVQASKDPSNHNNPVTCFPCVSSVLRLVRATNTSIANSGVRLMVTINPAIGPSICSCTARIFPKKLNSADSPVGIYMYMQKFYQTLFSVFYRRFLFLFLEYSYSLAPHRNPAICTQILQHLPEYFLLVCICFCLTHSPLQKNSMRNHSREQLLLQLPSIDRYCQNIATNCDYTILMKS